MSVHGPTCVCENCFNRQPAKAPGANARETHLTGWVAHFGPAEVTKQIRAAQRELARMLLELERER